MVRPWKRKAELLHRMAARHLVDSARPREPRARKGLEDGGLPWAWRGEDRMASHL